MLMLTLHVKISTAKWWQLCTGINILQEIYRTWPIELLLWMIPTTGSGHIRTPLIFQLRMLKIYYHNIQITSVYLA